MTPPRKIRIYSYIVFYFRLIRSEMTRIYRSTTRKRVKTVEIRGTKKVKSPKKFEVSAKRIDTLLYLARMNYAPNR